MEIITHRRSIRSYDSKEIEAEKMEERLVDEYKSLVKLTDVDVKEKKIRVEEGNYFK